MPTLPTNPQSIGASGHVNDHNTIVTNLAYLLTGYQQGNKNRVINPNFAVNQRGYASGTNLASGSYGFDRWKSAYTNTALTFTAAPQGQTVTISTAGVLQQVIERANIPAGSYTLSWIGTATGRVYNSGGTAPAYASSPITVSLDGSANVVVEFTASGATKTLANVQLEAGSSATTFEFESISDTIRKCQRYYEKSYDIATAPGTNTTAGMVQHSGSGNASGRHYVPIFFQASKRSNTYTVTTYRETGADNKWATANTNYSDFRAPVILNKGNFGFVADVEDGGYAWLTGNVRGHWVADAEL